MTLALFGVDSIFRIDDVITLVLKNVTQIPVLDYKIIVNVCTSASKTNSTF